MAARIKGIRPWVQNLTLGFRQKGSDIHHLKDCLEIGPPGSTRSRYFHFTESTSLFNQTRNFNRSIGQVGLGTGGVGLTSLLIDWFLDLSYQMENGLRALGLVGLTLSVAVLLINHQIAHGLNNFAKSYNRRAEKLKEL